MTSTERFVALIVGIFAIIAGIAGMIRLLAKISWEMGKLIERFGDHISDATKIHADQEQRIRLLERGRRR